MMESNFIKDNFFFIDSNNLDQIKSRLYGFVFQKNKLYINYKNGITLSPHDIGVYINIVVDENSILIQQEYNGKIPIYIYRKNDYFACSNSLLFLAKTVADKHSLSFNEKFSQYILAEDLTSTLYGDTIINEIICIPRNATLLIDKKTNRISIHKKTLRVEYIDIDTQAGLTLLDDWYNHYASLIHSLMQMGKKISVDLSGGFDSRAVFTLFTSDNTILRNCRINTSTGKGHTLTEDFEIASQIARLFDCKLNKNLALYSYPISSHESLYLSFFTKMTFHKQMLFKTNYQREHAFHFTGAGGECIRQHWSISPEKRIHQVKTWKKVTLTAWHHNIEVLMRHSFSRLKKDFSIDQIDIHFATVARLYREGRCRNHFGLGAFEGFLGGSLSIQPLMNYRLEALNPFVAGNTDRSLIIALIYTRYAPQLLDIRFDSKKTLDKKTLALAKKINTTVPFSPNITAQHIDIIDDTEVYPKERKENINPRELMFNMFKQPEIAAEIISLYGQDAYDTALREKKEKVYFGDELVCMELSVALIKKLCDKSKQAMNTNTHKRRKSFFDIPE